MSPDDAKPDDAKPDEEELNISGSDPTPQKPDQPDDHERQGKTQKIEAHLQDLSHIVGPGASNEDLVDALLQVPTDQLITWEECMLPSMGIYYGWPDGICRVKPMGQTAEKILSTQRLVTSGQSIDHLFRECCRFPDGFDPSELLLGDRVFILYFLRGITHGNMYEFAVTCPNSECEAVNTHAYDLNDLASTIKQANPSLGEEPFRINLPYLSESTGRDVWVSVRFLRAYDANDMIARRRARKKTLARPGGIRSKTKQRAEEAANLRKNAVDPRSQERQNVMLDSTLDDNMEKIIVDIMGVQDRMKIRNFVQRLHARDTATIREWLRDNTPGIDNTVEIDCPDCGNNFTVELPITENFFRPSKG